MKRGAIVIYMFLIIFPLIGQKAAFIAPLESSLFDEETGVHLTRVLEEGIIKTGAFRVITTGDLELLLAAQSLLISDIFQEGQKIGSLIPAEVMISAELLKSGDKVYIHLKVTDLESGKKLTSESVSTVHTAEALEEALKLGAFKLAGQSIPPQAPDKAFQLTLNSEPVGGEVVIDGRRYGTTPLVLENIPGGSYFIEIKKENYYYSTTLLLQENKTIYEELTPRFGNLLIDTTPSEGVRVWANGVLYGEKKLISDLPARPLEVLLRKEGYYWKGTVPIQSGETVKVDRALLPTASLNVDVEEKVRVTLISDEMMKEFLGSHLIEDLVPGKYRVEVKKEGFAPYIEQLELVSGESRSLAPELTVTEAEYTRIQEVEAQKALLEKEIEALELPRLYKDFQVPTLEKTVMLNSAVSLVPLLDITLIYQDPLIPEEKKEEFRRGRAIQFALGFLAQAFAVTGVMMDNNNQSNSRWMFYSAAALAATDLGFGIYLSSKWYPWSKEMKEKRGRYQELKRQQKALEKE